MWNGAGYNNEVSLGFLIVTVDFREVIYFPLILNAYTVQGVLKARILKRFALPTTQEKTLHMEHHKMVNTQVRLIILFAAKDGEALYSQQKQDWELTVAQTMNSLLPNSDLN